MNLELVPSQPDFSELFLKWRSESRTRVHSPVVSYSPKEARARLRGVRSDLSHLEPRTEYRWFIRVDGELVGSASITGYNEMMRTAEVGYIIGEDFAGRGIGTAALRALVAKAFLESEIRKLTAMIHVDNVASWKLAERVGFK
jgi:[ribosomal protein S5]-alanine N-acetyltransferase